MEYQKITKVSKNLQQNNSETVTSENDKEIPKEIPNEMPEERYTSQKKEKQILIIYY